MEKENIEVTEQVEEKEEPKMLSQDEVNRLIAQSKSKAKEEAKKELEAEYQEQLQSEVEEAKRLAKMNEDEQQEHQLKKLQEELETLKKKEAQYGLAKEASKMLTENKIMADEKTLRFVVKDTAEETQAAVKEFVELINEKVEQGVKEALAGKAPKVATQRMQSTNKEEFEKMTYLERLELKKEKPDLYDKLIKGD